MSLAMEAGLHQKDYINKVSKNAFIVKFILKNGGNVLFDRFACFFCRSIRGKCQKIASTITYSRLLVSCKKRANMIYADLGIN
jgi:hypothetical protein